MVNLSIKLPDRKVSLYPTLSTNNPCEIFRPLVLMLMKCFSKPEERSCSVHCSNTGAQVQGPLPSTQILSSLLTFHLPTQEWASSLSYNSWSG